MLLPGNKSSSWAELPESNRSEAPGGGGGPGLEAVIVPVVFGLIFVVGVVGNSLVILVIGKVKYGGVGGGSGRRSGNPTNIFILNLSVADLSFLLFCVPFQATIYSLPQWVFGAFLCRFGHYFSTVSMLVSIFTLAAMSVDRYIAVVRSKKSPCVRSRRNALAGVCVIWTLSVVCSVPVAQHQFLTSHPNAPNSTFCWEEWSGASRLSYKVSVLLLGYLLPLLLICCCYTRTVQTVLLVVSAFTICWLPHHIIAMWVEFGTFPLNDASFAFRIISHCLSYGNSCVNPILYAFLSENFRKACHQVFTCRLIYPPPRGKVVRFRIENFSNTHSTTNI
ncbi:galanin receptor type 1b isoform X2 [Cottoperca gobio]|uniref:Galanin receptor type 1b isoform X2 n=1 Tax=Cottoperca gobio TaxID=56716 RepID=A0A6J2PDB1_COTGO|nr:galanin receptor type 1-like isoform X2 [Cottoperca gobio]